MLPRQHRLTKESEFKQVLSKGKTVQGKLFALKILESTAFTPSKIGIITSKKIAKQAVYRNRARRRLRETIRTHLKELKTGYLAVILTKREIVDSDYATISEEVEMLFGKGGLL